jgi:hypothetical protein
MTKMAIYLRQQQINIDLKKNEDNAQNPRKIPQEKFLQVNFCISSALNPAEFFLQDNFCINSPLNPAEFFLQDKLCINFPLNPAEFFLQDNFC